MSTQEYNVSFPSDQKYYSSEVTVSYHPDCGWSVWDAETGEVLFVDVAEEPTRQEIEKACLWETRIQSDEPLHEAQVASLWVGIAQRPYRHLQSEALTAEDLKVEV